MRASQHLPDYFHDFNSHEQPIVNIQSSTDSLNDTVVSSKMLELAEYAHKLSEKHNLKDQAKKIEVEGVRIAKLLEEEKE